MKVIVIATGRRLAIGTEVVRIPAELLPVNGRSLLLRRVEDLVDRGARDIVCLVAEDHQQVAAELGDGERLGVAMTYRAIVVGSRPPVEVAARQAAEIAADAVVDPVMAGVVGSDSFGGAESVGAYLAAVIAHLNGRPPAFVPTGVEVTAGVRLSHHVRVHRKARLVAPVFIGADADIAAGAVIGPNVAIERGVFVGKDTAVRDAVVLPMTVIGENLELFNAVVDGNRVFRPDLDAAYAARDRGLAFSVAARTR